MSETKKEITQDAVKQIGAYKSGKLAELISRIAEERAKADALIATVRSRRAVLVAQEEAKRLEEERLAEEAEKAAAQTPSEKEEPAPEPVPEKEAEPVAEPAPEVKAEEREAEEAEEAAAQAPSEKEAPAPEPAPEKEAGPVAEPAPEVKAEEKKEQKKAKETAKAPEKQERKILPTSNPSVKEEILPDGQVRRIYVPPTPASKSQGSIKTRVFEGGYSGGRSPRPQGDRPQTGTRPFGQGGMRTGSVMPPANIPAGKSSNQKGKNGGKTSVQRSDDRGKLSKRDLMKKGYIVDDTKMALDDEETRVRVFKARSKSSGGGQVTVIDHAVITSDPVPIKVLSEKTGIAGAEIIKTLFMLGIIKTINESVDFATAELVIGEITKGHPITLELKPEVTFEDTLSAKLVIDDEDTAKLKPRPPVVTIMGHVDHGKTSPSRLHPQGERRGRRGGRHNAAHRRVHRFFERLAITFLDTPGHEAFTSMRARGAQVTDIAVLVVAADDGIMPQTIEAINHAKQAEVPIIVAINKIDKQGANPDQVLQQLTNYDLLPEEWGGEDPRRPRLCKDGRGRGKPLENILIMAEIRELKANPDRPARGTIIEARLDKGVGKVATILVQTGTLRIGDNVVAGTSTGKIRAMVDDKGRKVKKAGPSTPVSVTGWDEVPEAGDIIDVVADEKFARELAEERRLKLAASSDDSGSVSSQRPLRQDQEGRAQVRQAHHQSGRPRLPRGGQAVPFQTRQRGSGHRHHPRGSRRHQGERRHACGHRKSHHHRLQRASRRKCQSACRSKAHRHPLLRHHLQRHRGHRKAVKGLLEPKFRENVLGSAEVRELFKITGVGIIAGCHVTDGKIVRGAKSKAAARRCGADHLGDRFPPSRQGRRQRNGEELRLRHHAPELSGHQSGRRHRSLRNGADQ